MVFLSDGPRTPLTFYFFRPFNPLRPFGFFRAFNLLGAFDFFRARNFLRTLSLFSSSRPFGPFHFPGFAPLLIALDPLFHALE